MATTIRTKVFDSQISGTVNRSSYQRMRIWWGSFRESGDYDKTVYKVNSIVFTHSHSATKNGTWSLAGRIVLANGTTFTSPYDTHRISGVTLYTNVFTPENTICSDGTFRLPNEDEFKEISAVHVVWNGNNDSYGCKSGENTLYWWTGQYNGSSFWWQLDINFEDEPPTNYKPVINTFNVWRSNQNKVPDDVEGEYITANIGINLTDIAGLDDENSYFKLYYSEETPPNINSPTASYIDFTSNVQSFIKEAGQYTQILLDGTWSLGSMYYFTLVFSLGEEKPAVLEGVVPRGHVPIHISSNKTGGVAIGKYSSATDNNPKFEVAYPVFFAKDLVYGDELPETGEEGQVFFLIV